MTTRLRVGMGDSYGLRVEVRANADFDPTLVDGVTFKITKPGGASVNWTGEIESQDAQSAVAAYTFNANGLDLDVTGKWTVWLQWTQPGRTPGPRTEVGPFQVVAANQQI